LVKISALPLALVPRKKVAKNDKDED